MKDQCFIYNNETSLYEIFNNFKNNLKEIEEKDWNAYKKYMPEKIMDKFNELFIKPLIIKS